MATVDTNPRLAAALLYAAIGWPVAPLHTPDEAGICDCAKRADCESTGKHPRTRNGISDATCDEAQIRRWWTWWPDANVAIDLAQAGLVDIAPDSIEWYAEFVARGLPPTLSFASGGGDGHAHHLYARPENCAIYRDCQTGEYDILSNGYAVAPPSVHWSQRVYTWLNPKDGAILHGPTVPAPKWAVEQLNRRQRPSAGSQTTTADPNAPPIELTGEALERWYGRLVQLRPQGGVDRSYSLWWLAVVLLRAGCSAAFTEQLLAERDVALGWTKFAGRGDAPWRYRIIVQRAAASKGPKQAHVSSGVRSDETQAEEPPRGRSFVITNLSTVEAEEVEWLWQDKIPLGKLSLLDGDPDLGKSLITLDIAARLSRGHVMPDGSQSFTGSAGTVLLSAEDGIADTIRPRLEQAGGDPSRIVALEGIIARAGALPGMPSLEDLDAIEAAVHAVEAKFIVVDPIMAYLPSGVSAFKDQEVRRLLGPLVMLIARLGVALICVRHLNKDTSKPSLYRGGGTIGFAGAARSVMLVGLDPTDETQKRRVVARQKGNLAPAWKALTYETIAEMGAKVPHIRWGKESDLRADDLLQPRVTDSPETAGLLGEAIDFLKQTLADGQKEVSVVMAEATKLGISRRTLERAKARMGIRSLRSIIGDQVVWHWALGKTAATGSGNDVEE